MAPSSAATSSHLFSPPRSAEGLPPAEHEELFGAAPSPTLFGAAQPNQESPWATMPTAAPIPAFGGTFSPVQPSLSDCLAGYVTLMTKMRDHLYKNSIVIFLSAAVAGAANQIAAQNYPLLAASSDLSIQGSLNVAKFVGLACLFKTSLTPLHEEIIRKLPVTEPTKNWIRGRIIRYLNPIALTFIVAYTKGIPVKSLEGALYTLGTIELIKFLGKGFDRAFEWYDHKYRSPGSNPFASDSKKG